MRVLIEVAQSTNVHLFRCVARKLLERGHEVLIASRDREHTLELLRLYELPHVCLSRAAKGALALGWEMVCRDLGLIRLCRRFRPDLLLGHTPCFTHAGALLRIPAIHDYDDGRAGGAYFWGAFPFSRVMLTPTCVKEDYGARQIRYEGYKELAYLHPNLFRPDPGIRSDLGVGPHERLFVMRFSALRALHDIGQAGLHQDIKRRLVEMLCGHGRVFITSERTMDPALEPYQLSMPPHRIHDLLFEAELYVGDSSTMGTEAAVLGTPSIRCSSLARRLGPQNELEQRYGLILNFHPRQQERMLETISQLLRRPQLKRQWQVRREKMLSEKIDVAAFFVWFVETYPESFLTLRREGGIARASRPLWQKRP